MYTFVYLWKSRVYGNVFVFPNPKSVNYCLFQWFPWKKFSIGKNSSYTNLFATLAHVKICLHHMLASQHTWRLFDLGREFSYYPGREKMRSLQGSCKILVKMQLLVRSCKEICSLKDLARKCFPWKILQGNVFLERSCKESISLQDSWL